MGDACFPIGKVLSGKSPFGLVTVIMLWITASRGNLQSALV
ncbi:hypothetical protein COO91_06729 [Nostoc flagelliforme CCNUN1]|uniref:Uncharacterized protein n=1 Tax=Nostoc flagelliforme CCNUN1 TaxID=2038116 RepID=A0A2K8SZ37_9NOSO|nr:hypothetical protein COO91_06729 [Nostoc flagelliforme CCNUN1]